MLAVWPWLTLIAPLFTPQGFFELLCLVWKDGRCAASPSESVFAGVTLSPHPLPQLH